MLANGLHEVDFPRDGGMVFRSDNLPLHENGMQVHAFAGDKEVYSKTYYSIGGGFIVDEENFGKAAEQELQMPYPFNSAREMLDHCRETGLSLSGMVMQNELALHSKQDIDTYFGNVWQTMRACIDRGLNTEGVLPGRCACRAVPPRCAACWWRRTNCPTIDERDRLGQHVRAGGERRKRRRRRAVTAPTNGACGIVPAVLAYYDHFIESVSRISISATLWRQAPSALYKMNASISGAEVGCGVKSAWPAPWRRPVWPSCSAAALEQVCVAAEIGMEHNRSDLRPGCRRVQVPCIERNAIASVKAINAARMALRRTSEPRVSLDKVIETMYETGKDMNAKYRETSRGGTAIKVNATDRQPRRPAGFFMSNQFIGRF